jgi:gluconate kinase
MPEPHEVRKRHKCLCKTDKPSAVEMKYFKGLKKVFKRMGDTAVQSAKITSTLKKQGHLQKNGMINSVIDSLDEETQNMIDTLIILHEDTFYNELMNKYADLSEVPATEVVRDAARKAAEDNAEAWAEKSSSSVIKTMKDRTATFMQNAVESEMSLPEMIEGIQTIFSGDSEDYPWARTVARTESQKAVNAGKFQGMKDAGMKFKEWISGGPPNDREDHTELDSIGPVPMDYLYKTDNGEILFPGDPDADVSDIVNCRCTITESLYGPVADDSSPEETDDSNAD